MFLLDQTVILLDNIFYIPNKSQTKGFYLFMQKVVIICVYLRLFTSQKNIQICQFLNDKKVILMQGIFHMQRSFEGVGLKTVCKT